MNRGEWVVWLAHTLAYTSEVIQLLWSLLICFRTEIGRWPDTEHLRDTAESQGIWTNNKRIERVNARWREKAGLGALSQRTAESERFR